MGDVVLSGIRATGRLHFGNLLGAVNRFVEQQTGDNTNLYFVADWHTLTTYYNPEELSNNLLQIILDYIAAGLDPERSIIYAQSSIPEIAELSLYLGMLQPVGALQTIPTFRDLVRQNPNQVNLGMLTYPVLMASDILGPRATLVPVGSDQIPNIELARDLAQKFNARFGQYFTLPEMLTDMVRVPGLDGKKMGKSGDNAIDLAWSMEQVRQAYADRGITDGARARLSDPGDPYNGCASVYPVHEIVTPGERETREIAKLCLSAQIGCGDCKMRLVDSLQPIIEPFQDRRRELEGREDYAREVLVEGGRKARAMVAETVGHVREVMGIKIYA